MCLPLLTVFSNIFCGTGEYLFVGFVFRRRTNVSVAMQPFLENIYSDNTEIYKRNIPFS